MFTDLNLSRDLGKDYRAGLVASDKDVDLIPEVMILQQSVWPFTSRKGKITAVLPTYVRLSLSLSPLPLSLCPHQVTDPPKPSQLQEELTAFTEYYQVKYKGRTLEWDHSLGTATLEARFAKGSKRLTVSLYQAVILLLFNAEEELGFEDIKAGSGMGAFFFRICHNGGL